MHSRPTARCESQLRRPYHQGGAEDAVVLPTGSGRRSGGWTGTVVSAAAHPSVAQTGKFPFSLVAHAHPLLKGHHPKSCPVLSLHLGPPMRLFLGQGPMKRPGNCPLALPHTVSEQGQNCQGAFFADSGCAPGRLPRALHLGPGSSLRNFLLGDRSPWPRRKWARPLGVIYSLSCSWVVGGRSTGCFIAGNSQGLLLVGVGGGIPSSRFPWRYNSSRLRWPLTHLCLVSFVCPQRYSPKSFSKT